MREEAWEVIGLAERGLGLSALTGPIRSNGWARDLSTYLRQPFPRARWKMRRLAQNRGG